MQGRLRYALPLIAAATLGAAACGEVTTLPEAPSGSGLTASSVGFTETGDAQASIDQSSVTYRLDDSGSLVIHLTLTSSASADQTVLLRASLYDSSGELIDDANGSAVMVAPAATVSVQLNGNPPQKTIASATFEVTLVASPTPTAASPSP